MWLWVAIELGLVPTCVYKSWKNLILSPAARRLSAGLLVYTSWLRDDDRLIHQWAPASVSVALDWSFAVTDAIRSQAIQPETDKCKAAIQTLANAYEASRIEKMRKDSRSLDEATMRTNIDRLHESGVLKEFCLAYIMFRSSGSDPITLAAGILKFGDARVPRELDDIHNNLFAVLEDDGLRDHCTGCMQLVGHRMFELAHAIFMAYLFEILEDPDDWKKIQEERAEAERSKMIVNCGS